LDALIAKGACDETRVLQGKELLSACVGMLTGLVQAYSDDERIEDEKTEYRIETEKNDDEDENENENENENDEN
jgi:hypothetical protein